MLLNWAQHEKNIIEYAHCLLLIQVILISLEVSQNNWWNVNHAKFVFNKTCQSMFEIFSSLMILICFSNKRKVIYIIPEHTYKSTVSHKANSNSHRRGKSMVRRVKHTLSWFMKYKRIFPVTIYPRWPWVVTSDSLTRAVLFKDSRREMQHVGWGTERPLQLSLSIN